MLAIQMLSHALFALFYTEINVKSSHFLFFIACESPLSKGGSEGVWKDRWLQYNVLLKL